METGKSAREDKILNECLRVLEPCLVLPIIKLLNLILDFEKYPSPWCSTVLYLRILEVNEKFQLITNKQIGFLKGFRTADHLIVLDTIINEVVHKHRQKLFVAFVDL